MLNLESSDLKGESVDSVRELNLELVEYARLGIEGVKCGSWK